MVMLLHILLFCLLITSILAALIISFLLKWSQEASAPPGKQPEQKNEKTMKETTNPISILEVKVSLPSRVIFASDRLPDNKFDPSEFAQIPAIGLGEGTLGPLFKAVLNNGSIATVRKVRKGLGGRPAELERWIRFFGKIHNRWLCCILFSFWYGREAFVVYEYMCLGSLEELLHGREGIQFTSLNWGLRMYIAICAATAVESIHGMPTDKGEALVCGVIKSSNLLIRTDFSACLSGYENPYLDSFAHLVRRNPGRVAPELTAASRSSQKFTPKSDVYSFGVLLLELITGNRPMVDDAGVEVTLVAYVQRRRNERGGLLGLWDDRMGDVVDGVEEMVQVAELCLQLDPAERPSMDVVVKMLEQLQN